MTGAGQTGPCSRSRTFLLSYCSNSLLVLYLHYPVMFPLSSYSLIAQLLPLSLSPVTSPSLQLPLHYPTLCRPFRWSLLTQLFCHSPASLSSSFYQEVLFFNLTLIWNNQRNLGFSWDKSASLSLYIYICRKLCLPEPSSWCLEMECFLLIISEACGLGYREWEGRGHVVPGREHCQAEPGVSATWVDPSGSDGTAP